MVQDTETEPGDYIAQVEEEEKEDDFEPHTSQGDLQHGNAIIRNIEDAKSKSVYENTTVDDNINATNDKNPEAVADNISAREHFDDRSGIKTSHYNLRPRKERDYYHFHTILEGITMTQYPMHKGVWGCWHKGSH